MDDKIFNSWQKWLTNANVFTIRVGILLAFAGITSKKSSLMATHLHLMYYN